RLAALISAPFRRQCLVEHQHLSPSGRSQIMPNNRKLTIAKQKKSRHTLDDLPAERPLKAYAFDPSQGKNLGNYMTANVPYEPLKPGPVGNYLGVIDKN